MVKGLRPQRVYQWNYQQFFEWRTPEPYDYLAWSALIELDAADKSTTFLLKYVAWNDDTADSTFYGIEAPRKCPMRSAFEWGELSWEDYWTHKDWLLKILVPFNPGPVISTLMSPADIDPMVMLKFRVNENRFPYELKREHLETAWKYTEWNGRDPIAAERKYREFMMRHGHRFEKKAA